MKKIVSLCITFLFVFGFVSNIFSSQGCAVDINNFDEFSIDQVQKTFSNTLTQEQKTNTEDTTSDFLTISDIDCNLNISISKKIPLSNLFFTISDVCSLNYLYKYKLFDIIDRFNSNSITQYKMNFNSYIAVVLFDTNSIINYFI